MTAAMIKLVAGMAMLAVAVLGMRGDAAPEAIVSTLTPADILDDLNTIAAGGHAPLPGSDADLDLEMLQTGPTIILDHSDGTDSTPPLTDLQLLERNDTPNDHRPVAAVALNSHEMEPQMLLEMDEGDNGNNNELDAGDEVDADVPASVVSDDLDLLTSTQMAVVDGEQHSDVSKTEADEEIKKALLPAARPLSVRIHSNSNDNDEKGIAASDSESNENAMTTRDTESLPSDNADGSQPAVGEKEIRSTEEESLSEDPEIEARETMKPSRTETFDIDWAALKEKGVHRLDKNEASRLRTQGNATILSAPDTDQCQIRRVKSTCFTLECSISHWISDDPDATCRMVVDKKHGHPDEMNPRYFPISYLRLKQLTDIKASVAHTFDGLEPGAEYATGLVCETRFGEIAYIDPVTSEPYKVVMLPDHSTNVTRCPEESLDTELQAQVLELDTGIPTLKIDFLNDAGYDAMIYRTMPDGRELAYKTIPNLGGLGRLSAIYGNMYDKVVQLSTFPTHIWRVRAFAGPNIGKLLMELQAVEDMNHKIIHVRDCFAPSSTCMAGSRGNPSFKYQSGYMEVGNNVHYDPFITVDEAKDYCCLNSKCMGFTYRAERSSTVSPVKVWFKGNASTVIPERDSVNGDGTISHWHTFVKSQYTGNNRPHNSARPFRFQSVDGADLDDKRHGHRSEEKVEGVTTTKMCPLRGLEITGANLDVEAGGTDAFNPDVATDKMSMGASGPTTVANSQTFVILPNIHDVVITATQIEDGGEVAIRTHAHPKWTPLAQGLPSELIQMGQKKVELTLQVISLRSGYATLFPIILTRRNPNVPEQLEIELDRAVPVQILMQVFMGYSNGKSLVNTRDMQDKMVKAGMSRDVAHFVLQGVHRNYGKSSDQGIDLIMFGDVLNDALIPLIGQRGATITLPTGMWGPFADVVKAQRGQYAQDAWDSFHKLYKLQQRYNIVGLSRGTDPKVADNTRWGGFIPCDNKTLSPEMIIKNTMRYSALDWDEGIMIMEALADNRINAFRTSPTDNCLPMDGFFQGVTLGIIIDGGDLQKYDVSDSGVMSNIAQRTQVLWESIKLIGLLDLDNSKSLQKWEIQRLTSVYFNTTDTQFFTQLLHQGFGKEKFAQGGLRLNDIAVAMRQGIIPPAGIGQHKIPDQCQRLVDAVLAIDKGQDLDLEQDLDDGQDEVTSTDDVGEAPGILEYDTDAVDDLSIQLVLEARGWPKPYVTDVVRTLKMDARAAGEDSAITADAIFHQCVIGAVPHYGIIDGFYRGEGSPLRLLTDVATITRQNQVNQTDDMVSDVLLPYLRLQAFERFNIESKGRAWAMQTLQMACREQETTSRGRVDQIATIVTNEIITISSEPSGIRVGHRQNWNGFVSTLEAFHRLDEDGWHKIHVQTKLIPLLIESGLSSKDASDLAEAVDANGNQYVDLIEFSIAYKAGFLHRDWAYRLTSLLAHHRMLFDLMDTSGSGTLSREETQGALMAAKVPHATIALVGKVMFEQFKSRVAVDMLGNRRLGGKESDVESLALPFVEYLRGVVAGVMPTKALTTTFGPRLGSTGVAVHRLERAFGLYDNNGNGRVSRREIVHRLVKAEGMSKQEAALVGNAALGGSGSQENSAIHQHLSIYTFTIAVAHGLLPTTGGEEGDDPADGLEVAAARNTSPPAPALLQGIKISGVKEEVTSFDPTGRVPYEVVLNQGLTTFDVSPIASPKMESRMDATVANEPVPLSGRSQRLQLDPRGGAPKSVFVTTAPKEGEALQGVRYVLIVHAEGYNQANWPGVVDHEDDMEE